MLFQQTETDTALYPAQDPNVLACQAALQAAREAWAPVAQAWKDYCAAHADDNRSVPFSRHKQRLYDAVHDTSDVLAAAEAAHNNALDTATATATALWDEHIRRDFLADLPTIEAFIELLAKHEQTVIEAQIAGARHVVNVPVTFMTAEEVRTRLAYAKGQMGLS